MIENLLKLRKSDQISGKMAIASSSTMVGAINSVASARSPSQPKRGRRLVRAGVDSTTLVLVVVATAYLLGGARFTARAPPKFRANRNARSVLLLGRAARVRIVQDLLLILGNGIQGCLGLFLPGDRQVEIVHLGHEHIVVLG